MAQPEEFRIALTTGDYDRTLLFYREALGLPVIQEWPDQAGKACVFSLPAATLEIFDNAQAAWVDGIEVGRRVSGPVRLAWRFSDVSASVASAVVRGAKLVHKPVLTPWKDLNARLEGPDGMQMTFYQPSR